MAVPGAPSAPAVVYMAKPLEREAVLAGYTYKLKWPGSDHAIYITINDIERDGRRRPFEIFINTRNLEHYAWTVALTRMISAVFRRGGDVTFVVEELKAVFDPQGGQWMGGRYVPSLLAAIGEVIETHMIRTGFLPRAPRRASSSARRNARTTQRRRRAARLNARPRLERCPRCSSADSCTARGLLGLPRVRFFTLRLRPDALCSAYDCSSAVEASQQLSSVAFTVPKYHSRWSHNSARNHRPSLMQ